MEQFSKTWWGKIFIEALEAFTDSARLSRGRSYARNDKIVKYTINQGQIKAKVKGSINPYFGVYKEPLYNITIEIKAIEMKDWAKAIASLSSRAGMISKLLLNEIPDNIEEVFADLKLRLLPSSEKDFITQCSCPDWENPCKHIAGVYYLVASQLDQDPFLLFELRGISRSLLKEELAKSPLGKILSEAINQETIAPELAISYYTKPEKIKAAATISAKEFWQSPQRLPKNPESFSESMIPAILVKKGGDFPPFWHKESSFIEVMEEFYRRVKTKNSKIL